ncbi:hypothetical protein [Rubellimicrobium aerolatum]|uniref:Lipoprotein n=1 Tax=Rubellimicrobium aerolatum TaxID=490979 RepID=A0ABW0SFZ2_9RHOB|nr:hypothetical protein [Rubellimicrobium aerolatum]MBP1807205.1 hypothetical protein [Rubellimicrobium aerolatum]
MRRRAVLAGLGLALLGGCGTGAESVWAPDAELMKARYRDPGPPRLALVTVRNEGDGSGAHSALLISGSERVLFDPYGGWTHPGVPERNDVLFGFSPAVEEAYLSYQAQDGYYYVRQEIAVPPEVAEQALALAKAHGPAGMAECTFAVSGLLRRLPGFEPIRRTWFPEHLASRFARLPGVTTTERHGPPAPSDT